MAPEIQRPAANFPPSLWGNQFVEYNSDAQVAEKERYSKSVEVLKKHVREMITAPGSKMVDTMMLIDTVERVGLSYHFETEIEEKLQQFFNLNTDYSTDDLYTVALHFRLFRQHGYRISCDIFGRWIDGDGKFLEGLKNDPKGLLSLYEASYLRTHGESILDEALDFATASLKSMAPLLESPLGKQVEHALVQSLHFGFPRIEARNFISLYEEYKEEDKDETLLRFAKFDYNLVQMLHKEELREVSRWGKELIAKSPYSRDRIVECYYWALGVYDEPHYSRARVMNAKAICLQTVLDDTYDAYGTIEELHVFTEAIQRWNIGEMNSLPEYMKPLYKNVLELYEELEEELAKEGRSYAISYSIESLKELMRSYFIEAKWFIQGNLPPFEEYLQISLISCTYTYLTMTSWMGMQSAMEQDFEWVSKKPKMLLASLEICRLVDDAATYEVEKSRGQVVTGIECYMNDKGVTKDEAVAKFIEMATDAWKDLNEEWLVRPSPCSRQLLMRILNLSRVVDVTYKGNLDGFTLPAKVLKPHIVALFVDPIQI